MKTEKIKRVQKKAAGLVWSWSGARYQCNLEIVPKEGSRSANKIATPRKQLSHRTRKTPPDPDEAYAIIGIKGGRHPKVFRRHPVSTNRRG